MRAKGFTVLIACAAASFVVASPRTAAAQGCMGEWTVTATQVGQDVRFELTNEETGAAGGMEVVVTRDGPDGPVEVRGDFVDEGCTLTMPEPGEGCGCWAISGTAVEECVPPGTYQYTVAYDYPAVDEPSIELETIEVTVTDSGDACLPSDPAGEDGSCAMAGHGPSAPGLLALLGAALLGVRRVRRSGRGLR
jgi:MYXO-CTERM domain-containing protein